MFRAKDLPNIQDRKRSVTFEVNGKEGRNKEIYEGWNFNSGNYLFTTDTK